MNSYDDYRKILNEIPQFWKTCRFKDVYKFEKQIAKDKAYQYERLALTLKGVIKRSKDDDNGLQPKDFYTYQIINEGDMIFKMLDLQNISTSRVGKSSWSGLVSPAYLRFTPKSEDSDFLYYYFMSLYFNNVFNNIAGNGVRSSLNSEDIGNILCPFPPLNKQIKISQFLKNKISKIDKIIEIQENEINLIKKYKNQKIFKTINSNVKNKIKLKYACKSINSNIVAYDLNLKEGKTKVYGASGLAGFCELTGLEQKYIGIIKDGAGVGRSCIYNPGTLLLGTMAYIFPNEGINIEWLNYILISMNLGESLDKTTIPHIYFSQYGNNYIPSIKLEEQEKQCAILQKICNNIKKLIINKNNKIEKLKEYKKSLIFEYTTGKKEIK